MQKVNRLIDTFVPEHYELSLKLNRPKRTFEGTVMINGSVPQGASAIGLHAKDLEISSALLDGKAAEFSLNEDELSLTHPDLTEGTHMVVVTFAGKITDPMHGLYPCYFEHDGVKKELLATQFESHHAREVFPCVDEPEAKATFDVTLATETGVTVLGNMPVKQQREENGFLVTAFETSPRMSSYLLAFVIGELHSKTARTKGGVEVSVWATVAQPLESMDFPLDIAVRSIDFFDEYFGTPYPLQKSDHVALPDFSSGAMENWGLITYREIALLADPKTTSLAAKHYAATVIAHELSHQWFGNLVTMKWWNDLWLNESFANMMEYLAIDAIEPNWHIWLDHATGEIPSAMRRDSIDGVQSIQADVNHPDEIGALFDPSIVYAKGGRLLRMLQSHLGDDLFQKGLKLYFERFAYQNTEANDLWSCLSEVSGQDISTFMNTWITQPGYAVVHASTNGDTIELQQERFFVGPHQPSDALWPLPLHATGADTPTIMETATLSVPRGKGVFSLNTGATAHFITHYDEILMNDLLENLSSLNEVDRLELLNEQILLAQAGIISPAQLIPLLDHYRGESTEAVWDSMSMAIHELKKFVEQDEAAEKKLRQFVGNLTRAQYERLGWDAVADESESDTKLRSTIISHTLYSEDPEALEKARQLYDAGTPDTLDAELRVAIMASVVRQSSDAATIGTLIEAYRQSNNSELREDIAAALTASRDDTSLQRLIGLLKDQELIRMQDFLRWWVSLLRNRFSRTAAWQWTRDNWPWLVEQFKGDNHFDMVPRYIASCLMTAEQTEEYRAFFTPLRSEPALVRNIDMGISELEGRVELLEREGPAVRKALLDL